MKGGFDSSAVEGILHDLCKGINLVFGNQSVISALPLVNLNLQLESTNQSLEFLDWFPNTDL